ncbi:MAG: nucleotidyltransferase domain-containing protein [Clostridia bacterium]|jgi:predicted nucleotidyltransferase|nr:nucleotidyltransferase domain-containing protein [Clostridia bacterium]
MRLTNFEIQSIKKIVENSDDEAEVYLFGSRVDNAKRGGDIDLLVLSDKLKKMDIYDIKEKLYIEIGEQKIDIVLSKKEVEDTFVKYIFEEAVRL